MWPLARADEFRSTEAVVQMCSVKRLFLKISQNVQENTCARISFLINLQAPATLLKKETGARVFSCEFSKILKNIFFTEHLRTTEEYLFYRTFRNTSGRSSHRRCSMKKDVLENFAKFIGKHLWVLPTNSDEYSLPRNTNLGSTV